MCVCVCVCVCVCMRVCVCVRDCVLASCPSFICVVPLSLNPCLVKPTIAAPQGITPSGGKIMNEW